MPPEETMSAKTFVQSRIDDGYYTPDTPSLFRFRLQPLFVYGSLKKGFSRQAWLEDSHLVGTAFTRNTGWTMYRTVEKPFPIIFPATHEVGAAVHGEVYLVNPKVIRQLDFMESNGILYHRVLRTIDMNGSEYVSEPKFPKTRVAFMYVAQRSTYAEAIRKKEVIPCEPLKHPATKQPFYLHMKKHDEPLRRL